MKKGSKMAENLQKGTDKAEEVIIDGRVLRKGDKIYDLIEVVERDDDRINQQRGVSTVLDERLVAEMRVVAERLARELIPDIAERVIREEIEKLKRDDD